MEPHFPLGPPGTTWNDFGIPKFPPGTRCRDIGKPDASVPWYFWLGSALIVAPYLLWGLFILWFYAWKQLDQMLTRNDAEDEYAAKHDKWMETAAEAEARKRQLKNDVLLREYLLDELEQVEARLPQKSEDEE